MITKYIFVGIFTLILFYIAYASSRRMNDYEDYNVAGRRTGLFALTGTLTASELNTATLIGGASVAYNFGTVGVWYTSLIFIMVFSVYAFTVSKAYRRLNISTVPEFFDKRFSGKGSETLRILATIVTVFYPWFAPASYLAGITVIGNIFLGVNPILFASIVVGICLIVSLAGGLITSIGIDVFAFILMAIGIPLIFILGLNASGGLGNLGQVYEAKLLSLKPVWDTEVNFPTALTWGLQITFMYIGSPWYGQRTFAARSDKIAFTGMLFNMICVVFLYGLVVLATMLARVAMPNLPRPEEALPLLIVNNSVPLIQGFLLVALLFIAISTMIAVWNSAVSILVNDIIGRYLLKNKTDRYYINLSRLGLVVIATCTLTLGLLFIGSVQASLLYLSTFAGMVAIPILISIFWRRYNTPAALATMAIGLVYSLIALLIGLPSYFISPVAAILSLLIGIIITLFTTSKKTEEKHSEFFHTLNSPQDMAN